MSLEARNKETDRLIAEKVAAELTAKRQPVDPTGQNPVDPIKSASLKTDKGYATPTVAGQTVVGQDGSQPLVSGAAAPPVVAAPSAEDDYMAGINKLLKSSQIWAHFSQHLVLIYHHLLSGEVLSTVY